MRFLLGSLHDAILKASRPKGRKEKERTSKQASALERKKINIPDFSHFVIYVSNDFGDLKSSNCTM